MCLPIRLSKSARFRPHGAYLTVLTKTLSNIHWSVDALQVSSRLRPIFSDVILSFDIKDSALLNLAFLMR